MNAFVECATQAELGAAVAAGNIAVVRAGVFAAYGSSQVRASGSSQVTAYGSSQVRASGSSQVTASDSSQVTAYGSSQVRAYGSSQVTASDSSQVTAYGSSQVTAYGSSQVTAYGSSQVTASDSSQVRAYDSSQVTAYGSSQVTASKYVAVTVHGKHVKVQGGVLIEVPELTTAQDWCEFYGVEIRGANAVLFKAVDDDFRSSYKFSYAPGSAPAAPDWDGGKAECGGGLHFAARPMLALGFYRGATKFVACEVPLDEIVVHKNPEYPTKIKAPRALSCVEVDLGGKPVKPAKKPRAKAAS